MMGQIDAFSGENLDETISAVGGGTFLLKLVDLAHSPEELASTLAMLRDHIKENWTASEEMERIRALSDVAGENHE